MVAFFTQYGHFEVSAKEDIGIDEAFESIARTALKFHLSKEPALAPEGQGMAFVVATEAKQSSGCRCIIDDGTGYQGCERDRLRVRD
jgi:translation initiation factor IF-2